MNLRAVGWGVGQMMISGTALAGATYLPGDTTTAPGILQPQGNGSSLERATEATIFTSSSQSQNSEVATNKININGNLDGASAAGDTNFGALSLLLADALQAATQVDQTTGARQLTLNGAQNLATSIADALVQTGYAKQNEANSTAASIVQQLQSNQGESGFSVALNSKTQWAATQTTTSGLYDVGAVACMGQTSLNIGYDAQTGQLSVNINQAETYAESDTAVQLAPYNFGPYTNGASYVQTNVTIGTANSVLQGTATATYKVESSIQTVQQVTSLPSTLNASAALQSSDSSDQRQASASISVPLSQADTGSPGTGSSGDGSTKISTSYSASGQSVTSSADIALQVLRYMVGTASATDNQSVLYNVTLRDGSGNSRQYVNMTT